MIVKWLGHGSFLVKTSGKNIYIDPYAGEYMEKADVVLVSHNHRDHCDPDKIKTIRDDNTIIVTSKECSQGLTGKVEALSPGEKKEIYGVEVEAVEAYNNKRFRSPGVPFHPKGIQIAFLLSSEGKKVYHAGDTDLIPEMTELKSKNIDLALLPSDGHYTMSLDEAVEAALAIQPKAALPMHRRGASAEEFKKKVEAKSNIKVYTIDEGEEIEL
jgi:L-ascorbate metabolism protein UlaG (beta-lactamase superfamily)